MKSGELTFKVRWIYNLDKMMLVKTMDLKPPKNHLHLRFYRQKKPRPKMDEAEHNKFGFVKKHLTL